MERVIFSNKTKMSVADYSNVKYKKVNRSSYIITGSPEFLRDLDDSVTVGMELYKFQGNEYKKTPFKLPKKPFCQFTKNDVYFYKSLVSQSTIPEGCPVKKVI
jgi:hypothetical protein